MAANEAPATPLDDIRLILGNIDPAEYELRARLRSSRIMAHAALRDGKGPTTHALAWDVIEWATAHLYAPADMATLDDVAELCRRLLLAGLQAEKLEARDV